MSASRYEGPVDSRFAVGQQDSLLYIVIRGPAYEWSCVKCFSVELVANYDGRDKQEKQPLA